MSEAHLEQFMKRVAEREALQAKIGTASSTAIRYYNTESHRGWAQFWAQFPGAAPRPTKSPSASQAGRGAAGRKLPRNSPKVCSCWIHWQSRRSLLHPGTPFTWRAFTSRTSIPRALEDLVEWDPVDSTFCC